MISLPAFKRGDTWSLTSTLARNKSPVDITGYGIISQIRKSDRTLVADLEALVPDQTKHPGVFILRPVDPDTNGWPIAALICDIVFKIGDKVVTTETFSLPVIEEVTK